MNNAFLSSGFVFPVTEFFVVQYAKAYQLWLDNVEPLLTKDLVAQSDEVQAAYVKHMKEHNCQAILIAHEIKKDRLLNPSLPVGLQQ